MKAEIVSVGTELLLGHVVDSNAAYIARRLAGLGIALYRKTTVGDNLARLSLVVQEALARADVLVITGGLGPTEDDLTRDAVADALGICLVENDAALASIRSFFENRGVPMQESNRRQALMPPLDRGRMVPNPVGTAPGLLFEAGDRRVICLPGVPSEMQLMMDESVAPYLADLVQRREGGLVIASRSIKTVGIGESALEGRILDLAHGIHNPTVATYANKGECEIRVTARAHTKADADAMIDGVAQEVSRRLGEAVYGYDEDTLQSVVGQLLYKTCVTLATAESCTGGKIAGMITDVPGSSSYFERGYVTYSNRSKSEELGVPAALVESMGAVSRPVAVRMAVGAASNAGAAIGVSVTGIAGPGGGSEGKPVGLVHFGLCDTSKCSVIAAKVRFAGERSAVRHRSAKFCLDMIRRHMLNAWHEEITRSDSGESPE